MNLIGAVNYAQDSLAKYKARQQERGSSNRRKPEKNVENLNIQQDGHPLTIDPESNIGNLLDTTA